MYFQIKFWRLIAPWRAARLKWGPQKIYPSAVPCYITENFDNAAEHYQKNRWAFVENILPVEFHKELVQNWPQKHHFEPPKRLEKSYNIGFYWRRGGALGFLRSDPYGQYPTMMKFLKYLDSPEFTERAKKFAGPNLDLTLASFIAHDAGPGAQVAPHMDSVYEDTAVSNGFNMIFFINATGGKNSGNLTLSRDNELRDIIFEPMNLKNSVLIYDTRLDFYHGFPPIAKGKFRWAIGASFFDKKLI